MEIIIDTEDMKNFLFTQLVNAGLAPQDSDLDIITDILFDYLCSIGVMEETES